jgi:multiple sugar transport system ATP-binding protein
VALGDAKVVIVEHLGGETIVYATLQDGQPITVSLQGQRDVGGDSAIAVYADPATCHLFDASGASLRA